MILPAPDLLRLWNESVKVRPPLRPIRFNGKDHYLCWVHPDLFKALPRKRFRRKAKHTRKQRNPDWPRFQRSK